MLHTSYNSSVHHTINKSLQCKVLAYNSRIKYTIKKSLQCKVLLYICKPPTPIPYNSIGADDPHL